MTSKSRTITATYRITTPMFCGGADPEQSAELRLPSFKGALRFWWRTLMWGEVKDSKGLQKREAELFGSSDQSIGRSKVSLQIKSKNLGKTMKPKEVFERGELKGAQYFGYGVMNHRGELQRGMIRGGEFTVIARLHPSVTEKKGEIINALILLGTVGGLGSKSRKGFGSLTLTGLEWEGKRWDLPDDPKERIKQVLSKVTLKEEQPKWTAWSKASRVIKVSQDVRAVELLDKLGREQVFYRSWGRNGEVLREESEKNFEKDHDLSKGQPVDIDYPERVAFGLPHNYGKSAKTHVSPKSYERRASPLFIHIHQLEENQPAVGVLAFLPSLFLPQDERIKAFDNYVDLNFTEAFWNPIHGYLNRLIEEEKFGVSPTPKKTNLPKGEEVDLG